MPYGYYGYYFDPTYILIIIAAIISLIAQWRVNFQNIQGWRACQE
jgi:Zn-dependent membrane protease YugP